VLAAASQTKQAMLLAANQVRKAWQVSAVPSLTKLILQASAAPTQIKQYGKY
jgi:hypothetical protein